MTVTAEHKTNVTEIGGAAEAKGTAGRPAAERLTLFFVVFGLWLMLVWPVAPADGGLLWGDIGAGVLASAFVAWVMKRIVTHRFERLIDPRRYLWALLYLVVFVFYVMRASFDVAYRVLHPAMPIRPGVVAVKSSLRTRSARVLLAASITLTPGTLTLDIGEDGTFYIHWIDVSTSDPEEAARLILGRFEWFIGRIVE